MKLTNTCRNWNNVCSSNDNNYKSGFTAFIPAEEKKHSSHSRFQYNKCRSDCGQLVLLASFVKRGDKWLLAGRRLINGSSPRCSVLLSMSTNAPGMDIKPHEANCDLWYWAVKIQLAWLDLTSSCKVQFKVQAVCLWKGTLGVTVLSLSFLNRRPKTGGEKGKSWITGILGGFLFRCFSGWGCKNVFLPLH